MPDAYEYSPSADTPMRAALAHGASAYPPPRTGPIPSVGNVSPAPESGPLQPSTRIGLDVTDQNGDLKKVVIWANFPLLAVDEVVWTGDAFTARYAGSSSSGITGGLHFDISRKDGWPLSRFGDPSASQVKLRVLAFDALGQEA
jgi:hypothetical protein